MIPQIQYGVRGETFKLFIGHVLSLTGLRQANTALILCDDGLDLYDQAFTHRTVDANRNYEFYEFLGDVTVNKTIAWYLANRFPQLNCPGGIKILTRLKSNLVSKKSLASLAKQLSFWEFVSASIDVKTLKLDKTLEDVFEAFIAVTEILVDRYVQPNAGFIVCNRLISHLLDTRKIPLHHETLFDAKTRTKELFDFFGAKLGTLTYKVEVIDRVHHVTAMLNNEVELGKGSASIKIDAEQLASAEAIQKLNDMGYVKPLTDEYKMFLDQ
jgi:dsRNA-specific ribonuclease